MAQLVPSSMGDLLQLTFQGVEAMSMVSIVKVPVGAFENTSGFKYFTYG